MSLLLLALCRHARNQNILQRYPVNLMFDQG